MNFRSMLGVVRKIVFVLLALVIGVTVLRWTGEAFREHTILFLLFLVVMTLATDALARFVGKRPFRGRVKVIWLGLVCYLSFMSLFSGDVVRDKFGQKYVTGYYKYDDCENNTSDLRDDPDACSSSTYRVNGHLSPIIEGLSWLYLIACIACPVTAYLLWRNAQTNIETHDDDAQNAIKAARLRTAAEQGNAEAQESLGFFYCIGAGVPRDYVQAATWFRKAAEQGNAEGQFYLGLSYYKGEGVPKDYAQAAFWWRKAAEQGEDTAQYNLKFLLHDKGEDVPRDYAQAALRYRKAAEQGDAEAQFNLGDLYYKGHGVPQDYAEAYFWFALATAAEQNASLVEQTTRNRDEAASHLKPADLIRVRERIQEWFFDA